METFVLVAMFVFGEDEEIFARGPFRTESSCWNLMSMLDHADTEKSMSIGTCMPMEKYKRTHSYLPLQGGT